MKNNLNIKIVGSGPTGILLSIALSKLGLNVFLTDLLTREKLVDKDKTYAITHSTKKILEKFNLWEKLKPFLYGFDTLSILDSETRSFTILTIADLDKDIQSANRIGWILKHSDLMNVFFQEVDNQNNIFFINPSKLSKKEISFDYQFISTGVNSLDKHIHKFLFTL